MKDRMPGESIEQFAIRVAFEYGHFWNPNNPEGHNVTQADLVNLKVTDPVVVDALISLSKMDATAYTRESLNETGKLPAFDGRLDNALLRTMDAANRCPIPDYAPPAGVFFAFDDEWLQQVVLDMQMRAAAPIQFALGSGNWKSCHGQQNIHCCTVMVDSGGLPSFLKPVFKKVLVNVQKAYADVGLLFRFLDQQNVDVLTDETVNSNINIDMSFVGSSSGWIGLAIVGTGESCGGRIWCRFLNTYKGGNSEEAIITQWTTLIKHELGHNTGRGHTSGGVMNPSIVNGLPTEWALNDPSTPWLKQQFSGVPVPIPGTPKPPDPPKPPTVGGDWEKEMAEVRLKNTIQDVQLQWLTESVRKLQGK